MKTMARLFMLAVTATLYAGCGEGVAQDDATAGDAAELGQSRDALVYCYAGSCDNQDPGAMGCEADATTVAQSDVTVTSTGAVIGKVAIRYSAACRAAWARTSSTVLSPFYLRATIYRGNAPSEAASSTPVTAIRSRMWGVTSSGTTFKAVGYAGNFYNDFSYAKGTVSAPIY
jgi:hypothetical protein